MRAMRRVAEYEIRGRMFGPKRRVRVDLHGVSLFGPGADEHTLIRWERIEKVEAGPDGVHVVAATAQITLPSGSFGIPSEALAEQLRAAADHEVRGDVIAALAGDGPPPSDG